MASLVTQVVEGHHCHLAGNDGVHYSHQLAFCCWQYIILEYWCLSPPIPMEAWSIVLPGELWRIVLLVPWS